MHLMHTCIAFTYAHMTHQKIWQLMVRQHLCFQGCWASAVPFLSFEAIRTLAALSEWNDIIVIFLAEWCTCAALLRDAHGW